MLGDRLHAHLVRRGQLAHGRVRAGQPGHHVAAGRIGQCGENLGQRVGHEVLLNQSVEKDSRAGPRPLSTEELNTVGWVAGPRSGSAACRMWSARASTASAERCTVAPQHRASCRLAHGSCSSHSCRAPLPRYPFDRPARNHGQPDAGGGQRDHRGQVADAGAVAGHRGACGPRCSSMPALQRGTALPGRPAGARRPRRRVSAVRPARIPSGLPDHDQRVVAERLGLQPGATGLVVDRRCPGRPGRRRASARCRGDRPSTTVTSRSGCSRRNEVRARGTNRCMRRAAGQQGHRSGGGAG